MYGYRWIDGRDDHSLPLSVRRKVFIEEQGYTEEQEIDSDDNTALHLVVTDGERAIGSGRLIPEKNEEKAYHAGRIALLPEYRGKGLGRYVVDLLSEKARELGAEKVYIGAQKYAVPFYEKCGYRKCSVEYPDGHITHIKMCRSLVFDTLPWYSSPMDCDALIYRNGFEITEGVKSVFADIAVLGFFEGYINGEALSDGMYYPAWSDYCERDLTLFKFPIHDEICHRAYYMHFDITKLVKVGMNSLALHIGNGWFGQNESRNEGVSRYGEKKLCCKITVTDERGNKTVLPLLGDGEFRESYIRNTNIYFGEYHDYRRYSEDIAGGDGWLPAAVTEAPDTVWHRQWFSEDRVIRKIRDPKIIYRFGDTVIYDIGENLAGFAVLRFPEKSGENSCIYVRYAENLNDDGSLNFHSTGGDDRLPVDVFRKGGAESDVPLYPHFTWHSGRYVEVRGAHRFLYFALAASDVKVSSSFSSSDKTLNWLYEAFIRTEQSNIHCFVPSDCPHRERLGYTGDGQLVSKACMTVFDAQELYRKWMRDIADCQDISGGHVQHTAPFYGGGGGPGGWGCAIVAVPWNFYKFYGDKAVLEEYYCHMIKYLDYMLSRCEDGIVTREEDGGWCLGDWCPPHGMPKIPEPFVNTYFYIRSLRQTAAAARIIGMTEDIPELERRDREASDALVRHYFNSESGSFCEGIEGADAFALDLGLGDERTERNLIEKYLNLGEYDTGIFGTDIVTKVLFERGAAETALRLLVGDGEVSFNHMMKNGATTLWENWFNENSSSHPMFGAVTEYLFTYILGIRQSEESAGFADYSVSPAFLPELSRAEGSMKTPVGTIHVIVENGKLVKNELIADG